MNTYDVAVVGIGMIGSAALRALAEAEPRLQVVGVGPAEPADWASYPGPFASHYDHARITRVTDPDRIWAELARRSIAAYPEIAARGGVAFHFPAGHLRLGRGAHDPALAAAEAIGHELGAPVERLGAAGLAARFPALRFPEGAAGLHEGGGSGWISPRNLVAAQLAAAGAAGATLVRNAVTAIRRDGGGFALETRGGERVAADRVVVSADGNAPALLAGVSGRTLRLERQAHTTVLAELSEGQAAVLAGLPSTIWPLAGHPVLPSVYTTPAARYPDGRWYLKIGGPLHEPHLLEGDDAVRTWFQSPGNPVEIAALQGVLLDLFPGLEVAGWRSKPCMNTYTAHDYPYVDRVEPGLFVCTGGCGAAAKSSDAIGRLGAMLARGDTWDDPLPAESFRAVYT